MRHRTLHRAVASTLVATTILLYCTLPVSAGAMGSIEGRVTTAPDHGPRGGVVVRLVDDAAKRTYRSSSTDARGAFRVQAEPGTYRVLVDTPEGAFLASNSVKVAAGHNPPVSLSLKRQAGQTPPPPSSPSSGMATWQKAVIVGAIAVGALLVVDGVTQDEKQASPF
jgi:hypothetical protein